MMKKVMMFALSLIGIGILFWGCSRDGEDGATSPSPAPQPVQANEVEMVEQEIPPLERKPLEPEATKRLADGPQVITMTFEATGQGRWDKNGFSMNGYYSLVATVRAESEIISKEEDARGRVNVIEHRKFTQVRDHLSFSEVDFGLALFETLPVEDVFDSAEAVCSLVSVLFPGAGEVANEAVRTTKEILRQVDGTSVRGILKAFGVKIPQNIDDFVNELTEAVLKEGTDIKKVNDVAHAIEGTTWEITYRQDSEGVPMHVNFKQIGGKPLETEDDTLDARDILRLANVFIDAQIIPDKTIKPMQRWDVDAEVVAALLDSVTNGGTCEGKLHLQRLDDLPNGDWSLMFDRTKVNAISANGSTKGVIEITGGNGIGDSDNAFIKCLQLNGRCSFGTEKKSRRWKVFDVMENVGGKCEFRTMLKTDRKE